MIERGSLSLWRNETPWRDEVQIEQDLVLSRALVESYQQEVIAETCTLRGGTALNKLVFRPAARYSEDIDLVQETPGAIGPLLDSIRGCIDSLAGQAQGGKIAAWNHYGMAVRDQHHSCAIRPA